MLLLEQHTIFLALGGSQGYGIAREGSDLDLRGVCVAPLRLSLFRSFEQYEGALPEAMAELVVPRIQAHATASRALNVKTECVIYDVAKFMRLCATANPSALEMLFVDEHDWLIDTKAWRTLHDERHRFLTKKVQQTFLSYAVAQLKKIQTHRARLIATPTPAEGRNPARAELERRHGYDTKHAMHLIRIMRMGVEALETGELRVRRDDAKELLAIRDGAFNFDELLAAATTLQESMARATSASTLPDDVNQEWVDAMATTLMLSASKP